MDISLPLDYAAIERILPHRLSVPARRSHHGVRTGQADRRDQERDAQRAIPLAPPGEAPVLPPTILTEAVAQVGAIMILAKPENREKLIYFMGIERVRYRARSTRGRR